MNRLESLQIDPKCITLISVEQAWHYRIVPSHSVNGELVVYCDGDFVMDQQGDELEVVLRRKIVFEVVDKSDLDILLAKFFRRHNTSIKGRELPLNDRSDDFIEELIKEARLLSSSDIHLEAYEENARVRIRIDGHLVERYRIELSDYTSLINKVKIRANLDISEKRLPQDGRILLRVSDVKIDLRVSILPTMFGEKVVLRLLNSDASGVHIESLGLNELDLKNYLEAVKKPNGIMLISGPTGSGKTTTLYATLKLLNQEDRNILTIEDPIEYTLEGVNQVQLKESIGLTFSSALRTFLRQDPDIIMLGEIRDSETAQMAIRASLTGHLVLSTIHTNSALGIIYRLQDMGIPSYLLSGTLNLAVAQRLIRLLCPHCKSKCKINDEFPQGYNFQGDLGYIYKAKGCEVCHYTGYKGRRALYEVIPLTTSVFESMKNTSSSIEDELRKQGITFLADKAQECIKNGETSVEEVYSLLLKY